MSPSVPETLADHARRVRATTLRELFARDPDRASALALHWGDWRVDFAKERLAPASLEALLRHAEAAGVAHWTRALFTGERINLSEQRPVLHTALRQPDDASVSVDGADVLPEIRATQRRMQALSAAIRSGVRKGATGAPIGAVVNIGIGGSDLGPRLVCDALADAARPGPQVAFVSNVDPEHMSRALAPFRPESTLFIVTSKTFTTQETLANAKAARSWLAAGLGPSVDVGPHFVGVTANVPAARAFGIAPHDVLPMWDWVGGRYSLWSAVGLPIAIARSYDTFASLLAGAAAMDAHFRTAPARENLPLVLGLVGWWNARWLGYPQRVVVPYAHALGRLPAFLQQLSLESNGKSVSRDGAPLDGPGAPSLWGEVGTDGQHAFFQWLHQGTHPVPVEFVVPLRARHPLANQQTLLVANALAQAQALLAGRPAEALRAELAGTGLAGAVLEAAVAARVCPGNRPSTTILLPTLDAWNLGALLALYEHRTFVEGLLLTVNSFDQWGVELGKTLATPLIAALGDGAALPAETDASTAALVAHARQVMASGD
jgi:glucose-6-phosphate isomerase